MIGSSAKSWKRWLVLAGASLAAAGALQAQDPVPEPEPEPPAEAPAAPAPAGPAPQGWRVDTLVIDEMSDVVAVRAMVGAKPGGRLQSALLGMECVMPKRTLETVLLVPDEVTWAVQPLIGEVATTRWRWSEEAPKTQGWGRYTAAGAAGTAMKMLTFVAPATRSFLKHRRARVEVPLAEGEKAVADFDLSGDARAALQAVFDHCRRKMPTP